MVLKESNLEIFYKFGGHALFLGENNSNYIYFFFVNYIEIICNLKEEVNII